MKFIDAFAGMGTVRMGFEQAGHECVSAIEFDPHKRRIYEVIFGHEPEFGDITAVRGTDLPYADCWCFGAPCQDFSIAGLRAGLDGERSSLVREVFRLVREKAPADRPEWLLYENVKGMLSSNNGWDFAAIQAEMGQCGYDVQWQLLNSKNFGVPQNRERVYTLGHLRTKGSRKIFPIGESDGVHNESISDKSSNNEIALCLTSKGESNWTGSFVKTLNTKDANGKEPPQQNRVYSTDGVMTALSAQLSGRFNIAEPQVKQIGNVMPTATRDNPNQGRVYDTAGLAPCLNKMEGGGREPLITEPCACLTPDRLEKQQNGRRFKEPGEPMFTLTKQDIHGVAIKCVGNLYDGKSQWGRVYDANGLSPSLCSHSDTGAGLEPKALVNTRIRRLTPRECMRLQGVPDYITDKLIAAGISDTQLYRAAGDACTVNVIYEIARRLS